MTYWQNITLKGSSILVDLHGGVIRLRKLLD